MLFLLISDCIRIITAAIQCISLIISGQHAGISFTCRPTQWSKKIVFRSTERIHCIDKIKCEIWHRRAPLCKILLLSGQTCGNTTPKPSKFKKFVHKIVPHGRLVSTIFYYKIRSICTHLHVSFMFLIWSLSGDRQPSYKHFSFDGGIFPYIFNNSWRQHQ